MDTQSYTGHNVGLKSKHTDFTFALHDEDQINKVLDVLPDFPFWAYINHIPDDENGSDHTHFYIRSNPLTIKALAEKLDLPPHMIEWVRVKCRMIQYFTHKNNPDKNQYKFESIATNDRELLKKLYFADEQTTIDINDEFSSLSKVAAGLISPHEYIRDNYSKIASLPFYSRQLFLFRLVNLGERGENNRSQHY